MAAAAWRSYAHASSLPAATQCCVWHTVLRGALQLMPLPRPPLLLQQLALLLLTASKRKKKSARGSPNRRLVACDACASQRVWRACCSATHSRAVRDAQRATRSQSASHRERHWHKSEECKICTANASAKRTRRLKLPLRVAAGFAAAANRIAQRRTFATVSSLRCAAFALVEVEANVAAAVDSRDGHLPVQPLSKH